MRYALVGDLGATNMRAALVDDEGRVHHKHSVPTLADRGRDDVLERFLLIFDQVQSHAGEGKVIGIGLAVAGPTDPVTGMMHNPPNIPAWHGFSAKPALEGRFSLPVIVANDASLAALAECRYGAGRGYRHVIYITVSTGIGGGIVIDGKTLLGAHGFAAEIGHITIDRKGPICNCGNVGCWEALSSGTAIARIARERLESGESSILIDHLQGDLDRLDARLVVEAAGAGDAVAREVMAEVAVNLGKGIVSLIHAFDTEVFVIGGGLSQNLDAMLPAITLEINQHAMRHHRGRAVLVRSQIGDDVGMVGAATAVFDAAAGKTSF